MVNRNGFYTGFLHGVFQAEVSEHFCEPNKSAAEAVAGKDFDDRSTIGLTRGQSASYYLILAPT